MRTFVRTVRPFVPRRLRRLARVLQSELPARATDWRADLRGCFGAPEARLPPARLRRQVGLSSSRAEFERVGEIVAEEVLRSYRDVASPGEDLGRWLDFGCGPGRVARHLSAAGVEDLWGVDVDRSAIEWMRRRQRGGERFSVAPPRPPLRFADGMFDVVLAVSVFSHFDRSAEGAWLDEIARILRPGGLLIASTHGPDLTVTRGDLTPADRAELAGRGHLFAAGNGPFNEDSAFHTLAYQERVWGRWFDLRLDRPRALGGFQDLSLWAKSARENDANV